MNENKVLVLLIALTNTPLKVSVKISKNNSDVIRRDKFLQSSLASLGTLAVLTIFLNDGKISLGFNDNCFLYCR